MILARELGMSSAGEGRCCFGGRAPLSHAFSEEIIFGIMNVANESPC